MTDTIIFSGFIPTPEVHRKPYRECFEDQVKKTVRYTLDAIDGPWRSIYDQVEKRIIEIKGERAWKKWMKEHDGDWTCDF